MAGAAVSAYGAVQQGRAQGKMMEHQAAVEESNATQTKYDSVVNESVANANREQAQWQMTEELSVLSREQKNVESSALASFASSGLSLESGSLEGLLSAEASDMALKRRSVRAGSAIESRGFNMQARGARDFGTRSLALGRNQAAGLRVGASNARTAGVVSGIGTAFSGFGSAVGMMTPKE